MTPLQALHVTGSLGFPSKMPGTSYGLPATACITGAKLAMVEGSTCEGCYAFKGHYQYRNVHKAQAQRLAAIDNPLWVDAMVAILHHTHFVRPPTPRHGNPFQPGWHRWHDSGDLQSGEHLLKIIEVAKRLPKIKFWLPTRELKMVKVGTREGFDIPPNLMIRVSATMVDGAPSSAWPWTSTVHSNVTAGGLFAKHASSGRPRGNICPAPKQDNQCASCRNCWSRKIDNVSYHKH